MGDIPHARGIIIFHVIHNVSVQRLLDRYVFSLVLFSSFYWKTKIFYLNILCVIFMVLFSLCIVRYLENNKKKI
jgi:hypothetical protein